ACLVDRQHHRRGACLGLACREQTTRHAADVASVTRQSQREQLVSNDAREKERKKRHSLCSLSGHCRPHRSLPLAPFFSHKDDTMQAKHRKRATTSYAAPKLQCLSWQRHRNHACAHRLHIQRGASAIEFALVFPLFFLIVYAIITYGL